MTNEQLQVVLMVLFVGGVVFALGWKFMYWLLFKKTRQEMISMADVNELKRKAGEANARGDKEEYRRLKEEILKEQRKRGF